MRLPRLLPTCCLLSVVAACTTRNDLFVPVPGDAAGADLGSDGGAGTGADASAPDPDSLDAAQVGLDAAPAGLDAAGGESDAAEANPDLTSPAFLALDKQEADFQAIAGCAGSSVSFRVTNTGRAPSGPLQVTVGKEFDLVSNGCAGLALPPGGGCDLRVQFHPLSMGGRSATLVVKADPGGQVEARLTGTGLGVSGLGINPNQAAFGSVLVGEASAAVILSVYNIGGADVAIGPASLSTSDFLITGDRCSGKLVPSGGTCELAVTFRPQSAGLKSAALTLWTSHCGGATVQAGLVGMGLAAGTQLVIEPDRHDFVSVCIPGGNSERLFKVTNWGQAARGPFSTSVEGPFQIVKDGCRDVTVPTRGSCEVSLATAFTVTGPHQGKLSVAAPGAEVAATLSGTGYPMFDATFNPASLDFGSVAVGQASAPIEIQLLHPMGAAPASYSLAFNGVAAADFILTERTCGAPVLGGSSCRAVIVFRPSAAGFRMARLTSSGTTCGGAAIASLTGTGI